MRLGEAMAKILVVEDDPIYRKLLEAALHDWNHQCTIMHDGGGGDEIDAGGRDGTASLFSTGCCPASAASKCAATSVSPSSPSRPT